MKAWSVVVLALVGLVLAIWWSSAADVHVPGPAGAVAETRDGEATPERGSLERADGAATEPAQRRVSASTEAPAPGSLHVLVRRETGEAVAGVPVEFVALDGRDERSSALRRATDPAGEVRVAELAAGTWRLRIGQVVAEKAIVRPGETTRIELTLAGARAATVKVVDEASSPVAGAEVRLWLADRYQDAPRWQAGVVVGRTDVRGELALAGITQRFGNGSWVQATASGLGASMARMIPVVDDDTEPSVVDPVVLTVSRRRAVASVIVADAAGRAVADAEVTLRPVDAPTSTAVGASRATPFVAQQGATDARGIVRFAPLVAGQWQVAVRAVGHGLAVQGFSVRSEAPLDVRVVLEAGAQITGKVTDAAGLPLAEADVSLRALGQRLRATTDRSGSFAFAGLPAGSIDWFASCDGHVGASGSVDVSRIQPTSLPIVLQPMVALRGRLLDASGAGLSGWRLAFHAKLPGYRTDWRRATSGSGGSFELMIRPEVGYQLDVTAPDSPQTIRPPAFQDVRASDSPLRVVIGSELLPSSFVSLRLVDRSGQPALAGFASVRRSGVGRPLPVAARDEETGVLRLGPMLAGACVLQFLRDDGFEFRLPEFELVEGADRSLGDIAWPQHGTLVLIVAPLPDNVPGDVMAELEGPFGQRLMKVDAKTLRGSVSILPGSWNVTVYGDGFRSERVSCEVVAGQQTERHVVRHVAVRVPIRVVKPSEEETLRGEILLPDGTQLFDFEIGVDQLHDDWAPQLSVSEYRVEAVGGSGRRYRASLPVESLQPSSERRRIVLAPVDGR